MTIQEALVMAKANDATAVFVRDGHTTSVRPLIGRLGTMAGGATFNDYSVTFDGNSRYVQYLSWDELISTDWTVQLPQAPKGDPNAN